MYKYSEGFLIDAEFNGAANIAVKVATQLNLNLAGIGRAALTLPRRVDLFEVLSKSFGNIDLSKDSDTPRPLSSPGTGNPLWFALTL